MNPKEIGAFLKQLRNEKGITQEQLAETLGVSGRTVSRWETGVSHSLGNEPSTHAYKYTCHKKTGKHSNYGGIE